MNIVADENIPFAREAFGQFGKVRVISGRGMDRRTLADADALIVRSVTRVDSSLLAGTPVRFVGTATIGTDHLDLGWLAGAGIRIADAAGANSRSVAEYVITAVLDVAGRIGLDVRGATLGIVGVGRIGTLVRDLAASLGMKVVVFDPPRAEREPGFPNATIGEVLRADIVTLHVPLTIDGAYPTHHMIGARELAAMNEHGLLLNTSRGSVVESPSLVEALDAGRPLAAVLDVWEGEPDIPRDLVALSAIATPHVAGYSYDGKLKGTRMIAESLAQFAGVENRWTPDPLLNERAGTITLDPNLDPISAARVATMRSRDLAGDDRAVRELLDLGEESRRDGFDRLRREYPRRREFRAWSVRNATAEAATLLNALGFGTEGRDGT